jgi:hypothetical protein
MPVIKVQSQPTQIVLKTLSRKNPSQKRAGGVAHGVGPEFSTAKKKKKPIVLVPPEVFFLVLAQG